MGQDIAVSGDDLPLLFGPVQEGLRSRGFEIRQHPANKGRCPREWLYPFVVVCPVDGARREWFTDPHVDVFIMCNDGSDFRFANPEYLPAHSFGATDLFPLRPTPFGEGHVYVPQWPERYLDRAYSGWRTHAVLQSMHHQEQGKFELQAHHVHPAQPMGPLETQTHRLRELILQSE